jgi:prepilin-type N-terminal cleavage/methylation domain-containing protein
MSADRTFRPVKADAGFTLLEVIVALAITGFLLGGLFSLLAGSKQLSWRSEESLVRAINTRAALNFALLEDGYSDVEEILERRRYEARPGEFLEDPERKTQATVYALEYFEVADQDREDFVPGVRLYRLELPR